MYGNGRGNSICGEKSSRIWLGSFRDGQLYRRFVRSQRLLLRRLGQVVVSNRRRLHPVIWRWFHVVGLRVRRRYL